MFFIDNVFKSTSRQRISKVNRRRRRRWDETRSGRRKVRLMQGRRHVAS